jgi:ATP-dependent RNA helicase RhlE
MNMPHKTNPPITPQENAQTAPSFYGLGIAPGILDILERIKFKVPTPIQRKAIPLAIAGKDVIGIAQTGTGKTHAFGIPMVQRLAQQKGSGLVLAPTRELALQIDEALQGLAPAFGMRTACLIGGAPMEPQVKALRANPRIIIATPGRLIDHMGQWNMIPDEVVMLVLDEADRMLDMGFAPQVEKILRFMPKERQTMLFSATIPKEIMGIAAKYMKLPVSIEVAPSGTTADRVTQELFIVRREEKIKLLKVVLQQYRGAVLLFSRTKHNAHKLTRSISEMGYRCAEIHSNRSLNQRREALEGFKSGKYRVLVATDIAARGIDVTGIELVLNYDLPEDAENYVHRIGRTARAGHEGHAISFATPDQKGDVRNIEKLIRAPLPIAKHPHISMEEFEDSSVPAGNSYRGQRGRQGGGSGGRPGGRSSGFSSRPGTSSRGAQRPSRFRRS